MGAVLGFCGRGSRCPSWPGIVCAGVGGHSPVLAEVCCCCVWCRAGAWWCWLCLGGPFPSLAEGLGTCCWACLGDPFPGGSSRTCGMLPFLDGYCLLLEGVPTPFFAGCGGVASLALPRDPLCHSSLGAAAGCCGLVPRLSLLGSGFVAAGPRLSLPRSVPVCCSVFLAIPGGGP